MTLNVFKQSCLSKGAVVASISTLFSAALASPSFARSYEFLFVNLTGQDIQELYLAPSIAETWGVNRLTTPIPLDGADVISFSDNATGTVSPDILIQEDCLYDVRAVLSQDNSVEQFGVNLCEVHLNGLFELIDSTAFYKQYETPPTEFFITNQTSASLTAFALLTSPDEQYPFFLFGDPQFYDPQNPEPPIDGSETQLLISFLPEGNNNCDDYLALGWFNNSQLNVSDLSALPVPDVTAPISSCDAHEILVANDNITSRSFAPRDASVSNNTPFRLEYLEIAPSFRPELFLEVLRGNFVESGGSDAGAVISLATDNYEEDCLYDIFASFNLTPESSESPENMFVERYGVDLCEDSNMTFSLGAILERF